MPCRHPSVVVTDDLKRYERLKLFILNLGHTYLAEGGPRAAARRTKPCARCSPTRRSLADLNDLYDREVLPVFDALGMGEEARAYRAASSSVSAIRSSTINSPTFSPIMRPRSSAASAGLIALAEQHGIAVAQPRLKAALAA